MSGSLSLSLARQLTRVDKKNNDQGSLSFADETLLIKQKGLITKSLPEKEKDKSRLTAYLDIKATLV